MRHEMAALKAASEEQQRRALENATAEQLLKLDADFETWAHANQLPPNGEGWRWNTHDRSPWQAAGPAD
jgi:hypothetical protein